MPRVQPDDPRAEDGILFVVFGVLALPLLVLGIGSFVVLPALAAGFFIRGVERGVLGWELAAGGIGLVWLVYLRWIVARLGRPRPRDDESS